jgi:transposase-like protein
MVVDLYLTGRSTREVGRILGCTNKTVLRILKLRGVERRPARRQKGSGLAAVSELKNAREIIAMIATGASKRQAAATLNVSFRTVQRVLERAGVCSNDVANSQGSAA